MEELKILLIEKWPEIIEAVLLGISYFLVFLYRSKVNGSQLSMKSLFKDTKTELTDLTIESQNKLLEIYKNAKIESDNAVFKYTEAVAKCEACEQRVARLENALIELLKEDESDE